MVCAQAQKGFSLLELLIAIAIISIAASMSIPSFQVWIDNFRLRGTSTEVMDALQRAKSEAVSRNRNVAVRFQSDGWQVFVDENNNFTRDGGELILQTHTVPFGISLHDVKFGGVNSFTGFNSRGLPINNNCAGTVQGKNRAGRTFVINLGLAGSVVRQ